QIKVNLGTGTVYWNGEKIFSYAQEEHTWSDIELGKYCSLSANLDPKILGTILDATISVSISSILKDLVGPADAWIIDLIVDDLALNIKPRLTGYIKFDCNWGDTLVVDDAVVNTSQVSIPVEFTMPDSSASEVSLSLDDLRYGVNFAVDWTISVDWAPLPSLIVDDQEWPLGTWPDFNVDLAEGTADLSTLAQYKYDAASGYWYLGSGIGDYLGEVPSGVAGAGDIPGFTLAGLLVAIGLGFVLLLHKPWKYIKFRPREV
ncbi:MAG: hypothetical protein ACTSU5_00860, partial [Promethearchaeota archaeon]